MDDVVQSSAYASCYFPGTTNVNLTGCSDAYYANNINDKRSINGYVFLFGGAPLLKNCET